MKYYFDKRSKTKDLILYEHAVCASMYSVKTGNKNPSGPKCIMGLQTNGREVLVTSIVATTNEPRNKMAADKKIFTTRVLPGF